MTAFVPSADTFPAVPPRWARAIAALVEGRKAPTAATAGSCSLRTLRRWQADPRFAAALHSARNAAFGESLAELRLASNDAIGVLHALMRPSFPPDVRLAAAKAVLAHALRANEQLEIERRLAAIEARRAETTE